MNYDKQYKILINNIISEGNYKNDRTGTGTISIFGYHFDLDISNTFPLLTLKHTPLRLIAEELFWFLGNMPKIYHEKLSKPNINIKYLVDNNVNIWNEWAYERTDKTLSFEGYIEKIKSDWEYAELNGDLGPIYGNQWINWNNNNINQIDVIINQIKNNPNDRGIILTAWNVDKLKDMALRPCHTLSQFYVRNNFLDCHLYQRSCDVFLGAPFNVASYSLLTYILAAVTNLNPGRLHVSYGDVHIYKNHLDKINEVLNREEYESPILEINKCDNYRLYKYEDLKLINYKYHPKIKADVAI